MSQDSMVSTGDVVKADKDAFYSLPPDDTHMDNYCYYARIESVSPDSDNDLRCQFLDKHGESVDSDYVDADSFDIVRTPPWDVDEELEERIEGKSEENALALLGEEKENLVQMQEIKARTVAPDVLRLDVNEVVSAENSPQWAILIEHPTLGEMRFYEEKPLTGWSEDYRIVNLLKSYGIHDGNPYKLQTKEVFVSFAGDDPEKDAHWNLLMRDEVVEDYGASPETINDSNNNSGEEGKKSTQPSVASLVADLF